MYLHRKCKEIPGTFAVYSCVWRLFSGSMAVGLLAFSSRQFALPINHEPLSASQYFSFLNERSGRRVLPAERSAL